MLGIPNIRIKKRFVAEFATSKKNKLKTKKKQKKEISKNESFQDSLEDRMLILLNFSRDRKNLNNLNK